MRVAHVVCSVGCIALGVAALGQKPAAKPTPLARLQAEAIAHNPGLSAARQKWRAARAAIAPAGALPDPEMEVQQMTVHVPAPFAGFRGNVMSYIGIGATQPLPYPGKLKLRAAVAASTAQEQERNWHAAQRHVAAQVADVYIALAEARALRGVLEQEQQALAEAEQLAELHYRTASGTQADVLAAQLEQTRLVRDLEENSTLQAEAQAQLRALLNQPPGAAPIIPESLHETHLSVGSRRIQAILAQGDPLLTAQKAQIQEAVQAAALAHKDFKPDFSVSYMFQQTGGGFPDRYMGTLAMSLPFFHRGSRQEPELEQALARQTAAQDQYAELQQQERFRLTQALLAAHNDGQILTIDQQGLLPQARAAAASALTAYASGKADLNSYFAAWREALAVEQQYWQTLAHHEAALATVTELTGVSHD